jgi:predicted nucleotidyltransferase
MITSPKNRSGLDDVTLMRMLANGLGDVLYRRSNGVVRAVEIFGSLSRGGGTFDSDFDMILCVDDVCFMRWMRSIREAMDGDMYDYSAAHIRRVFALEAIGLTDDDIANYIGIAPRKQDYFLFPLDWRKYIVLLQELGRHRDPDFIRNLSRDALMFVPNQGFAFPVVPRG